MPRAATGQGKFHIQDKEPQGLLLKALKMAATYSPTMRSTIGVAELGVARSPPLPCLPP